MIQVIFVQPLRRFCVKIFMVSNISASLSILIRSRESNHSWFIFLIISKNSITILDNVRHMCFKTHQNQFIMEDNHLEVLNSSYILCFQTLLSSWIALHYIFCQFRNSIVWHLWELRPFHHFPFETYNTLVQFFVIRHRPQNYSTRVPSDFYTVE